MKETNLLPSWIVEVVNQHKDKLHPKSKEFFDKALEIAPHFEIQFLNIPAQSEIGALKSYNPNEVYAFYGTQSPREFILLNILKLFHFQAIYQIRELGLSFSSLLEEGRFYVAAITNRAMLEVVCANYYTFRRVENEFKQGLAHLKNGSEKRSSAEKSKLFEKYGEAILSIVSKVHDANLASSIDWQKYLMKKTDAPIAVEKTSKLNVNEAIKDVEKYSKLPLSEGAYDLLSEFVHPNVGSKMLIVNTRRPHDGMMDSVTVGDNKYNGEAALFYVDNLAESLYYTLTLALSLSERSQKLIAVVDQMVPRDDGKQLH